MRCMNPISFCFNLQNLCFSGFDYVGASQSLAWKTQNTIVFDKINFALSFNARRKASSPQSV
jgi:hypothetical protein